MFVKLSRNSGAHLPTTSPTSVRLLEHKQGKRPIPPIQQLVSIPQGRLCARNSAEKRCLREAGALSKSMKTRRKNLFHDKALFFARAWIPRTT